MLIIGVRHPSVQQIAWADTETGECGENRLMHGDGEAERFYRRAEAEGSPGASGDRSDGTLQLVRALSGRAGLRTVGRRRGGEQ